MKELENLTPIEKLQWIMGRLRDPVSGCPWDLKQTFKSIVPHTLEEAYEVAETIENEDFDELPKELGDLLFQVIFYAQLGKEEGRFEFDDIANTMADKLIRRHPHVFGDLSDAGLSEQAIKTNWENIKAEERSQKPSHATSVLDDIPKALPALSQAYKIQKRAAHVGFDWPDVSGAIEKVAEEVDELQQELVFEHNSSTNNERISEELGDLFFALTNVSRHLGFNPEQVLRDANAKFANRFRQVESLAKEQSSEGVESLNLEQLEVLWQQVKQAEKQGPQ